MSSQTVRLDFEELEELRGTVLRGLQSGHDSTRRCWEDPTAWSPLWQAAVTLDLPGLLVPATLGGSGAGLSVLTVVLEAVGRTLAPIPLRSTASTSVPLLLRVRSSRSDEVLAQIVTGAACAVADAADADGVSTIVVPVVTEASRCKFILVILNDRVAILDSEDCSIVTSSTSADPSVPVAQVEIPVPLLANAFPVSNVEEALAVSRLGAAAELVGIGTRALDSAVEHSMARVQFDKPIGAFQSVKHRLVDLFVSINMARGLVEQSARLLDHGEEGRIATTHLAYAAAGESAVDAAWTNVRLHGAMGATWELDAHLMVRRARHLTQIFGSANEHYGLGAIKMERRFS